MRSNSLVVSLAAVCALASAASAQAVKLRGRVTDGSAAGCYYCPGYQHVFKYTGTRLESTSVSLAPFMNQDVAVEGTWNGTYVNVTSIQLVAESFGLSGGGTIGGSFDLNAHGTPGELAINLLALGAACVIPFADLGVQLNPASTVVHEVGVLDGAGEFESTLPIPSIPSLIGMRIFGQAVILTGAGTFYSTNADAKEIS